MEQNTKEEPKQNTEERMEQHPAEAAARSTEELWKLARELLGTNPYAGHNGLKLEHVEPDSAVLYTDLRPEFKNLYGLAHGGLMSVMIDNCAGLTVRLDGNRHVTLDMNICYFSNVKDGRLRAKSRVIRRGKTITVLRVEVTGDDGTLLAEGTLTFFRVG